MQLRAGEITAPGRKGTGVLFFYTSLACEVKSAHRTKECC